MATTTTGADISFHNIKYVTWSDSTNKWKVKLAVSGSKTHLPTKEVMRLQRFLHIRIPLWGHFLSTTKVCEHFLHSTQVKFLHCAHKFRTWREETLNISLLCFVDWRKSIMLQDHNHIRIECKQMHMVCQSLFLLLLLVSEKNKNPIHKYLIFYFTFMILTLCLQWTEFNFNFTGI